MELGLDSSPEPVPSIDDRFDSTQKVYSRDAWALHFKEMVP